MRTLLQLLLALLTLAAMVWATCQGYLLLRQQQLGLEPGTRSIVVISVIIAIICAYIISAAINNHAEKKFRGDQFANRMAVYDKCIRTWQMVLQELPADQRVTVNVHFSELEEELVLLASPKVLKAYFELQQVFGDAGTSSAAAKSARRKLLLAMREDLGQPVDYYLRKEIKNNY